MGKDEVDSVKILLVNSINLFGGARIFHRDFFDGRIPNSGFTSSSLILSFAHVRHEFQEGLVK